MPAALKVDWGAARALFVAGFKPDTIAEQLAIDPRAVQKRAERGKWHQERENVKTLSKTHPRAEDSTVSETVVKALSGSFNAWKESAINDVAQAGAKVAASLRQMVESDPAYEAQAKAFAQFEPASRVLKPFLGLNDGQQLQVGVQVNMLTEVPTMDEFELPK